MNRYLFFFLFLPFFFSCTTVDVENRIRDSGAGSRGQKNGLYQIEVPASSLEPEVIVVERPVYVPTETSPPSRPPAAGEQTVRASNSAGIIRPQDYSHAAIVYDYNQDWVYEVYAQPLRVCDISLQHGENVLEPPFVSDSERWIIGAGISYENGIPIQHIYIKPQSSGLEASLIINTDRRVYRIILRSFTNIHMPVIRWRYISSMPNNYFSPSPSAEGESNISSGIDPRFLSFNYRITYSLFQKPYWLPELVFDDGSKTYIQFPNLVLQREYPAVMENRNDILNYRVAGNLIIVDKLIENITVKIGRTEITISKKRGGSPDGNRNGS